MSNLIILLTISFQLQTVGQITSLSKSRLPGDFGSEYNFRLNGTKYCSFQENIGQVVDWKDYTLRFEHLVIGDFVSASYIPGSVFEIDQMTLHSRNRVSDFDWTFIQETWITENVPLDNHNTIFSAYELEILEGLNSDKYDERVAMTNFLRGAKIEDVQHLLVNGLRFYNDKPEVIDRLTTLSAYFHTKEMDFEILYHWVRRFTPHYFMLMDH